MSMAENRRSDGGGDAFDGSTGSNITYINYYYLNWMFAIRMLLTLDGVRKCVEGSDEDAARDCRALARICLSIQPSLYQFVRDAKTSKEAWKRLSDTFEDKGPYRKVLLLRQLHRTEYNHYANMSDYIEGVMKLVSSLETASLTNNLPSEVVRTRLLQEDHRRNNNHLDNTAHLANKKKQGGSTCTYCKKIGHTEKRCFKKRREEKAVKPDEHTMLASASAYSASSTGEFIIDSGATNHMVSDSNLVHETTSKRCVISIANGDSLQSESLGKVLLHSNVSLDEVLYVSSLSSNLISVSQITSKGYIGIFHRNSCKIYDKCEITGNHILKADLNNGLFKIGVQGRHTSYTGISNSLHERQGTLSANAAGLLPMSFWHKRMGHLHHKGMSILGGGGQCSGVVFQNDNVTPGSCVWCLTGEMSCSSFPSSDGRRAAYTLELIHSDFCGPMQVSSWGGARYLLTFTETFGYLMKNKSEVCSHFVTFKNFVEKQTGLHVKILRTDNGTEYCNSGLSSFFKREGFVHQTSVPYCPEQNGGSKRVNRTIFEKARAILQESCLNKRYWGEAVMTAIYLKNRSPTSALSDKIPECEWTGSYIDLSHLRVFGCVAYSHISHQWRR